MILTAGRGAAVAVSLTVAAFAVVFGVGAVLVVWPTAPGPTGGHAPWGVESATVNEQYRIQDGVKTAVIISK